MRNLALQFIETEFNSEFSLKQISHLILAKEKERPLRFIHKHIDAFRDEHNSIVRQLNYVVQELKKKGKIEKISHYKWRKNGMHIAMQKNTHK